MTVPSVEYVEMLLMCLYPYADIVVTPGPDGVHLELYGASFSLHASIGDERSPLLAVFEQLFLKASV